MITDMATKTNVVLEDDLTGETENVGTIRFGFLGTDYEIDLTEKNAAEMREALSRYVQAARTMSKGGRPVTRTQSDVDPKAVRAWAAANGREVSPRGRIPAEVVDAYRAAGN